MEQRSYKIIILDDLEEFENIIKEKKYSNADFVQVDLTENQINLNELNKLIVLILKPKSPPNLNICLWKNKIGDVGLKALANMLQKRIGSNYLYFNLWDNNISNEGALVLIKALKNGNWTGKLQFDLDANNIDEHLLETIKQLTKKDKNIKRAALSCVTFVKGNLEEHCVINKLPPEMLWHICSFLFPYDGIEKKKHQFLKNVTGFFNREELTSSEVHSSLEQPSCNNHSPK